MPFESKSFFCVIYIYIYIYIFFLFFSTVSCESMVSSDKTTCLQDFNVDALEKFIEESSAPIVTVYDDEPSNHPYIVKYFDSPLDKV